MKMLDYLLVGIAMFFVVFGLRWVALSSYTKRIGDPQLTAIETTAEKDFAYLQTYRALCLSCHGAAEDHARQEKGFAPPMWGVRDHYLDNYPEEPAFVAAIVNWVRHPNPKASHMKGAVKRFGLMAPLALPETQLQAIATLIYKGDLVEEPTWWAEHVSEHENEGMGQQRKTQKRVDQTLSDA